MARKIKNFPVDIASMTMERLHEKTSYGSAAENCRLDDDKTIKNYSLKYLKYANNHHKKFFI